MEPVSPAAGPSVIRIGPNSFQDSCERVYQYRDDQDEDDGRINHPARGVGSKREGIHGRRAEQRADDCRPGVASQLRRSLSWTALYGLLQACGGLR